MDGWMDGLMDGWMDGWIDIVWMNVCMCLFGWMVCMCGWIDDGWMGGWMYVWTDGWMDGFNVYLLTLEISSSELFTLVDERPRFRDLVGSHPSINPSIHPTVHPSIRPSIH